MYACERRRAQPYKEETKKKQTKKKTMERRTEKTAVNVFGFGNE